VKTRELPGPLLVIVGPTASGKTKLATSLATSLDAEIVSADSVQVYRHFDIGTGKPTAEQLAAAPHHLIDVLEPDESMDAASFAARADQVIDELVSRGKQPIVCGGSFLWVKALLFGLAEAPAADEKVRARHRELVQSEGRAHLHAQLAMVDPDSAARLGENDFVRVSRALEVFELSGKPMSEWQREHQFAAPRYEARLLGIEHSKEDLAVRIERRTRVMFEAGFIEEVRALLERGYQDTRAMGSVGYRQIAAALAQSSSQQGAFDQAELFDAVTRATRIFARRQRTWLREQPVKWLQPTMLEGGDPLVALQNA
jgi:tRNA dimethylallyltransferase